jgi:hypothetical protein
MWLNIGFVNNLLIFNTAVNRTSMPTEEKNAQAEGQHFRKPQGQTV